MTKRDVDDLIDERGLRAASVRCRVAAVLFTYRCSIPCRHCLFGCAADRPNVHTTARQCADYLALLHQTGRVIHVAGGEAMLYWDVLAEAIALAHAERNAPHFIETNCSFAESDRVVRERFAFMAARGVKGIYASADPYHQEHVAPERFLRVRRLTREIFGPNRFYGPEASDEEVLGFPHMSADEGRLRDYVRAHAPRMVGTAQKRLSPYLPDYAPDSANLPRATAGANCRDQFQADSMWELHIDAYGNLQTNCGMIVGRLPDTTPARLFADGPENANRFVRTVCEGGAVGLAELARREYGFVWPQRVTQACELCYLARRHLRRWHPEIFGPAEVYA